MHPSPGYVFWLFGLSGAGKSTLAAGLAAKLRAGGRAVLSLDGDVLRGGLCRDLGFTEEGRAENLRRAAEAARLAVDSGINVVASFITPRETYRDAIRAIVGEANLALVFVDASLAVCRGRDVKGLYARAKAGKVKLMTGIASSFERPVLSDLALHTDRESVTASLKRLRNFALSRLRTRGR